MSNQPQQLPWGGLTFVPPQANQTFNVPTQVPSFAMTQPITMPAVADMPVTASGPAAGVPAQQFMYRGDWRQPKNYAQRVADYNKKRHEAAIANLAKARETMLKPGWKPKAKSALAINPQQSVPLYSQYMHPNHKLLTINKPKIGHPLSRAERKARNNRQDVLNRVYSQFPEEIDKQAALRTGRKAYNELLGRGPRAMTNAEKARASALRQDKMAFHAIQPNAIYAPVLEDGERDKDYYDAIRGGLVTYVGENDYEPENAWAQGEIDEEDRAKAATAFAEATGVVGFMPTYDPRLTNEASAKQVYPDDDYILEFKDMDDNEATPTNMLIYEKVYDKDGNLVRDEETGEPVKGRMVAANGYRLSKPNEAQQIRRLRQMDYYSTYPTVDARNANKFGVFLEEKHYLKAKRPTGYHQIVEYIKDYVLDDESVQLDAVNPNKLFTLYTTNPAAAGKLNIFGEMSSIGWNTLMSRTARLFLELYIFTDPFYT